MTTEVIGSVFEAGIENMPHLVVAPKSIDRLRVTNGDERWTPHIAGLVPRSYLNAREKAQCREAG